MGCTTPRSVWSLLAFWSQEEPSRSCIWGTEWPRYGGCEVASARTHARSWRGKTGQPEWDLGPHSRAIKGPHEYYCALLSKSLPNYLQKVGQHTKNIAAKWWWRLQQLPPCSAQSNSTIHCAALDFPSFVQTMWFVQRTFIWFYSDCLRLATSDPARRVVVVLMERFASPHYARKSLFTRLYCQPQNATILSNKGAA